MSKSSFYKTTATPDEMVAVATSASNASTSASEAAASANQAATSEANALSHKNDAQTAKTASETARDASVVAKNASETAKTASEAARDTAKSRARRCAAWWPDVRQEAGAGTTVGALAQPSHRRGSRGARLCQRRRGWRSRRGLRRAPTPA